MFGSEIRVEPAQLAFFPQMSQFNPIFVGRAKIVPKSLFTGFSHLWVEPAQPLFWTFGFSLDITTHRAQSAKMNLLRHSLLNKVYFTKLSPLFSSMSLVA